MKAFYMKTLSIAVLLVVICGLLVIASEANMLKASVSDIDGRPMAGAKLFIYDSSNVRRPADFISPLSGRDGSVQIALPAGKYWVVARFKSDGKYGPLLPGDKHSGEPVEVDLGGGVAEAGFVVADIRELGQKKRANATDALRLKGRVLDVQGLPVAGVFVFANRSKEFSELPAFLSASTGADGRYELFLPPEEVFFLGVSSQLPLRQEGKAGGLKAVERGKIDIAIDIDFTVE